MFLLLFQGRCSRENCKYLHPPSHLKTQLEINGRNNLIQQKTAAAMLAQQMHFMIPGTSMQPVVSYSYSVVSTVYYTQNSDPSFQVCSSVFTDCCPFYFTAYIQYEPGAWYEPWSQLLSISYTHDLYEPRDEPDAHRDAPQYPSDGPWKPRCHSPELQLVLLFPLTEAAAHRQTGGIESPSHRQEQGRIIV